MELCVICDGVIESTSMPATMTCGTHFVHSQCVTDPLKDFENCRICAAAKDNNSATSPANDSSDWLQRLGAVMEPPPPEPKLSKHGLIPPVTSEGQYLATGRRIYAIMDENNECAFSLIHQKVAASEFPYSLCHMAVVERVTLDDFLASEYEWDDLKRFPEIADRVIVGANGDTRPRGLVNLIRMGLHPEHATQLDFKAIQSYYGISELFPSDTVTEEVEKKTVESSLVKPQKEYVQVPSAMVGHTIRIPSHLVLK